MRCARKFCEVLSRFILQGWDHSAVAISTQGVKRPPSSDCTYEGNKLRPARASQLHGSAPASWPAF